MYDIHDKRKSKRELINLKIDEKEDELLNINDVKLTDILKDSENVEAKKLKRSKWNLNKIINKSHRDNSVGPYLSEQQTDLNKFKEYNNKQIEHLDELNKLKNKYYT